MCGPYFNKETLKKDWETAAAKTSHYHVHIYFGDTPDSEAKAWDIALKVQALFSEDIQGGISSVPVIGPHTAPNLEIDIPRESFSKIISFLQQTSAGLSILIHPRTGDELKDHLESALWLGKPVSFNDNFFAQVKAAEAKKGGKSFRRPK